MTTTAELVYLYAVLPAPVADEVHGIDERPVRWLVEGQLAAALGDVPAADFEEGPLNEHIRDLRWLEPRAVAHQAVNARLHELSPALLPLAFGTVFRSDERVRDLLREEQMPLRERLEGVAGRSEWVVALHRQPAAAQAGLAASPALRALQAEVDAASPGRAHLLRRRLETERQHELARIESEVKARLLAALEGLADGVYPEALPAEPVERPVWRASLLVPRRDEAELVGALDRLRADQLEPLGYTLVLTGPWPPYRFGGLDPRHQAHVGRA